jgi:hypothetical protein
MFRSPTTGSGVGLEIAGASPATDLALGARLALTRRLALRAELRSFVYIEGGDTLSLDLKPSLVGQLGLSVLLGSTAPRSRGKPLPLP